MAPATALVLFEDALPTLLYTDFRVVVLGFLGYCEMYPTLEQVGEKIRSVQGDRLDIDFGSSRTDEVGELYGAEGP